MNNTFFSQTTTFMSKKIIYFAIFTLKIVKNIYVYYNHLIKQTK